MGSLRDEIVRIIDCESAHEKTSAILALVVKRMEGLRRYHYGSMRESPDGRWIKLADAIAALKGDV